jgi:hypothetical protein
VTECTPFQLMDNAMLIGHLEVGNVCFAEYKQLSMAHPQSVKYGFGL